MLPNRMQLNHQTEEQLKRLKTYTGLTPNISARLAFFFLLKAGLDTMKKITETNLMEV